jgi:hypothetical protein
MIWGVGVADVSEDPESVHPAAKIVATQTIRSTKMREFFIYPGFY